MKKILVIRVGRAGDIVMITPSLQALLDNYPSHEIHMLTSPDGKRVLNGFHERLATIYVFKSKELKSYIERICQARQIRRSGYDYIFNFELKPSYKKIYEGIGSNIYELDEREKNLHYAKRCLNVVQRSLEVKIKDYWDWLPVTNEGTNKARQQLLEAGIINDNYVIGIHPSFSGSKKSVLSVKGRNYKREWPLNYFATVINYLASYNKENGFNIKIIIDLLPDEKILGEKIIKLTADNAILFTLQPDFQRYKALLKRMDLLITPDTGPMHIAAAVGTRIICLFSGKSPEDCGPFMPPEDFLALKAEDYNEDMGLQAIIPEHVFEAAKKFLPKRI